MGLSPEEFGNLTPEELGAISKGWTENRRMMERHEWERTRMLATLLLQPYSKKRLKPEEVLMLEDYQGDSGESVTGKSTPGRMRDMIRRVGKSKTK